MAFMAELLATALRLGAATLHEAGGRIGALPSAIKPVAPSMRLAAPAFTVQIPPGDNLWLHRALYTAAPGDVLVVSTGGGREWGYWGDILNTAALARGLGGLVIDAGVRDSAQIASMSLPVFSDRICIRGTIKDYDGQAFMREPVLIGEVIVRSGDLIVADVDGVVALPATQAETAIARGLEREADEAAKLQQIRAGARTIDIYGFGER